MYFGSYADASTDKTRTALQLGEGTPIQGPADVVGGPDGGAEYGTGSLHPAAFSEVVGQRRVVQALERAALASKNSGRMPDPILLLGPSGLGKTMLAGAFANALGARLDVIDCSTLHSSLTLLGRLMGVRERDVVFFDEMQALSPRLCQALYEALEVGAIDVPFTEGFGVKTVRISLPEVAFVAATTNPERLGSPLRGRFQLEELVPYGVDELAEIVSRAATRDGIAVSAEAAALIARMACGTARAALALYKRLRTWLEADGRREGSVDDARATIAEAGLDERGLDPVQRRVIEILARQGRPLAMWRLAIAAGITVEAYRTIYEPGLLAAGVLLLTPRGTTLARRASR